jgi:hypothetical protein
MPRPRLPSDPSDKELLIRFNGEKFWRLPNFDSKDAEDGGGSIPVWLPNAIKLVTSCNISCMSGGHQLTMLVSRRCARRQVSVINVNR